MVLGWRLQPPAERRQIMSAMSELDIERREDMEALEIEK